MTAVGVAAIVLAAVVGLILALVVAALAVPVDVRYRAAAAVPFAVEWMWGAVRVFPRKHRPHNGAGGKRGRRRGGDRRSRGRTAGDLVRDARVRDGFLRLAVRVLRCIRVRRLALVVDLGLDDPGDTGLVYGWLTTLAAAVGVSLNPGEGLDGVRLQPHFDRSILAVNGHAHIRVVPLAVVGTIAAFAVGPVGRHVLITLWRNR